MSKIALNCDLGESFGAWKMGNDEEVMPLLDMANVACGFHASDPLTMDATVKNARACGVRLGAHPGYPDLLGFGRRTFACTSQEIYSFVLYQYGALQAIAHSHGKRVEYIKPHGAMYNEMMQEERVFCAVLNAVAALQAEVDLMVLASPKVERYEELARQKGVKLIHEVFADRAYDDEGYLVSRSKEGAVIHEPNEIKARLTRLLHKDELVSINGKVLSIKADSMCVHGDNKEALDIVRSLREVLDGEI